MRQFYCVLTLRNGLRFAGVINARSAGNARLLVRAEVARTDVESITAEEC